MSRAITAPIRFETSVGRPPEATVDAGRLTSDGGRPRLAVAEAQLGLCAACAAAGPEWRRGPVRHSLATLVRQRVFRIACGYRDRDDADTLRTDPLLKLACGRRPESGPDPASRPTLSRLENAVDRRACYRLGRARLAVSLRERARLGVPARILLDRDGTADPTHGDRAGSADHGYFRQPRYPPRPAFDGETDQLLAAVLRPGNAHGSRGAVAIPKRRVAALRARWPGVPIELRAASGFAVPAVYDRCEREGLAYTIGLVPHPRPEALAAPLLAEAIRQRAETGEEVRPAGEAAYRAAPGPRPRRVVFKAEALAKGPNTRFVVTTRVGDPLAVYARYVGRGTPEQWVGDLKRGGCADRLPDHRCWANRFRLLLHAAAYRLLAARRRRLARPGLARLELATLRLRLLQSGGRVRELASRVRLHLAASHPGEPLRRLLAGQHLPPVNHPG
jgi:Transposase DDE domain group 1